MSTSSVQALAERKNRQVSKRDYRVANQRKRRVRCWHVCIMWSSRSSVPAESGERLTGFGKGQSSACPAPWSTVLPYPPPSHPLLLSSGFQSALTTQPFILHLLGTFCVPGSVKGGNCLVTCLFLCWTPGSLRVRRDCVLCCFFCWWFFFCLFVFLHFQLLLYCIAHRIH